MSQIDAYLDPATGDLPEVSRFTTGIDLIQQRIRVRLRRGTGEYFLDPSVGLPLLDWKQMKPPNVPLILSQMQAEIRAVPGVISTSTFNGVHDPATRLLTITGDVLVGDEVALRLAAFASTGHAHNTMSFGVQFSSGNIRGGVPRPSSGRP